MTEEMAPDHGSTEGRRASAYLTAITDHFLEFGPLWEKTPFDVAYELSYHNAWHQFEVEQERKRGERAAHYHEIRLAHLQTLSQQNVTAFEERGEHESETYRIARYVDELIAAAIAQEEEIEQRMYTPLPALNNDDVPF